MVIRLFLGNKIVNWGGKLLPDGNTVAEEVQSNRLT